MSSKKIVSVLAVISLLTMEFYPVSQVLASARGRTNPPASAKTVDLSKLPPFPEDASRRPTEWSSIKWDELVVLPSAQEDFHNQLNSLLNNGDDKAIKSLQPKKSGSFK